MTRSLALCVAVVTGAAILAACNPALNWRKTRIEGLVAMLPCKPDQARRTVRLGNQEVAMQMAGCEASGALYAISHARFGSVALAAQAQTEWRETALRNMRATTVQTRAFTPANPSVYAADEPTPQRIDAKGRRPNDSTVHASLLWLRRGADLYHVAVYGWPMTYEMSDMLFSEVRLQ